MRYLKVFEDFKKNNKEGDLITIEDVIKCIKAGTPTYTKPGGVLYATIIKDFPRNDPKKPLRPISVDDDGEVTVEFLSNPEFGDNEDNDYYEVNLRNIESIDFNFKLKKQTIN